MNDQVAAIKRLRDDVAAYRANGTIITDETLRDWERRLTKLAFPDESPAAPDREFAQEAWNAALEQLAPWPADEHTFAELDAHTEAIKGFDAWWETRSVHDGLVPFAQFLPYAFHRGGCGKFDVDNTFHVERDCTCGLARLFGGEPCPCGSCSHHREMEA